MKSNEQYIQEVFQKYEYAKKEKKYKIKNKEIKIAAMIIISIGATAGIVYAGNIIYQKIWKEPERYSFSEIMEISEKDEQKSITQEEAIKKAKEITENFGKTFGNVSRAELNKINNKPEWYIDTENKISITLDSTGKLLSFSDWSIDDTKIPSTVNKQEAEKLIKEMYLKLGYKEGEYELSSLQKNRITDDANIWQADFCKKYDGIYNPYQCIRISIIPEVNHLLMLNIFDYNFENNPIVISQDEATEIAKEKAIELRNDKTIQKIETKLDIKKMNSYVYSREQYNNNNLNNITDSLNTDDFTVYKTEDIVRKVWVVEITYENDIFTDKDMYFVDCTTGEIIGGDSIL